MTGNKIHKGKLSFFYKLKYALFFQIMIYIVQYIIIPSLFKITPTDTNGNVMLIIITTALISSVGFLGYIEELPYWFIGLPLYYILVQIYHPQSIYGLDYVGIVPFATMHVEILTVVVGLVQISVWGIVKVKKSLFLVSKSNK